MKGIVGQSPFNLLMSTVIQLLGSTYFSLLDYYIMGSN